MNVRAYVRVRMVNESESCESVCMNVHAYVRVRMVNESESVKVCVLKLDKSSTDDHLNRQIEKNQKLFRNIFNFLKLVLKI